MFQVDPAKVTNNNSLGKHQASLMMYCEMVWCKIVNSACYFPWCVRYTCWHCLQVYIDSLEVKALSEINFIVACGNQPCGTSC